VALGGGGFSMEPDNPLLDDFVLSLARRKRRPRICFMATATGDSDSYIRRFHEAFPHRVPPQLISLSLSGKFPILNRS
jgi:peptidase E